MKKVLIIDDSPMLRQHIKTIFSKLDFEVILEASNGYEAVECYKKYKPDIVTMDIVMPEENNIGDGIDALKRIKEFDTAAKVVMITSKNDEEKLLDAVKAGADAYILKPIHQEKIVKVLEQLKAM